MAYSVLDLSTGSGFTCEGVAGESLGEFKLVHINSNGVWVYADASAEVTMPAVALTLGVIPSGGRGTLLLLGKIQHNDWSWTPGSILYASTVAGEITETVPSQSGEQVQAVGKTLSQTLILFNPSYVLVEVA